ncbi:MAG TPA: metallophosphoesterase [Naasia sp.]|jgi:predicted MPP superfamily phosphohydrolase
MRLPAALATPAVAGAVAFTYGSLVERTAFRLRRFQVPVLPRGSERIRVLHISDLHMAPWQRRKQEWVRALARLRPDIVVDTGDNLGHEDGIAGIREALEPFTGIPGVFVWGSNDYYGPEPKNPFRYFRGASEASANADMLDLAGLRRELTGLGWTDINNTAATLTVRGSVLDFLGVDDPHREFDRLDLLSAARDELDAGRTGTADLVLGVAHAPYRRILDSFVARGAGLLLAGHTHGGQVCVPGYGALVTNCDIPRKQVKGLSEWRSGGSSAPLHVSAGLGTSIYAPVRFSCPPEATLLTLTARR